MEDAKQRLDHARLMPVADGWARVGIQADTEVCPQGGRQAGEAVDAPLAIACLDGAELTRLHAGRSSKDSLTHTGVLAETSNLVTDGSANLASSASS
jgi:hypothetical protein